MKKRKILHRLHQAFLKVTTTVSVVMLLLSACAMDSDSWIPAVVLLVSTLWLFLVCVANDGFRGLADD